MTPASAALVAEAPSPGFEVVRLRQRPWVWLVTSLPMWVGIVASLTLATGADRVEIAFVVLLLGMLILGAVIVEAPFRKETALHLEVRSGVLFSGSERLIALAELREGWFENHARQGPLVSLRATRLRRFDFKIPGEPEARALLRALDLDADQATVTYLIGSATESPRRYALLFWIVVVGGSLATLVLVLDGIALAGPVFFGVLVLLAAFSSIRTRLRVGADGIRLYWLGSERFVWFREVERVVPTSNGVTLERRTLPPLTLVATSGYAGRNRPDRLGSAVVARISAAHAACTVDVSRSATQAMKLFSGTPEDADRWLVSLRHHARGATYRALAHDSEDLWSVAASSACSAPVRAGAVVLLASSLDEPARGRLLRVARGTASPRLADLMRVVARGSDEEEIWSSVDRLLARRSERSS